MKKIMALFLVGVGAIIGFISMIYSVGEYGMNSNDGTYIINPSVKMKIDTVYDSYTNAGMLIIAALFLVLIIFILLRFFSNSVNANNMIFAAQVTADIVLGIVLTETIFVYLDRFFGDDIKSSLQDGTYNKIYVIAFVVVYVIIGALLNFIARAVIKKPKRNCRLDIWQVMNEKQFAYYSEVIKKQTFEDCYGLMKHRGIPLGQMQFYVISELNWSGKKVVGQWKYYANGGQHKLER